VYRAVLLSFLFFCGCVSNRSVITRLVEIKEKHNVRITVDKFSNQAGLYELLGRIDNDLEICPQYFKDNIGPIVIEDSFDEIGFKGMFLIGYVDASDRWNNYPIHIKNRSIFDKILFFTPHEKNVFLHEAGHSFEFNIKTESNNKWRRFYKEFSEAQTERYDKAVILYCALLPLVPNPASMPSSYAGANHYEDFAETHCYLRRNNIERIKNKNPVLYRKCKIVEKFTATGYEVSLASKY